MCNKREWRKDPVNAEKDRQSNRRWKKKHPQYDKRPNAKKRRADDRSGRISTVHPDVTAYCKGCGIQLLDPDPLCGFCLIELPSCDKLRLMDLLPGQDQEWHNYFSLLSNAELTELIAQANLERSRRTAIHFKLNVFPKNTYRTDGKGKIVGPPAHHRRCPICGELAVNCKCKERNHAAA